MTKARKRCVIRKSVRSGQVKSELFQPAWNFLGLPPEVSTAERARAWILPVPYEATTTYGAGTRDGPAAIIAASHQLEFFEREFGCEPAIRIGIHTMNPLSLDHRSPEHMVGVVERAVAGILASNPGPLMLVVLGGEHTISVGVARGLAQVLGPGFVTVQVDAHADLRNEYEGTPYSHACTARRILGVSPVLQIGIRNIAQEEEEFRRSCDRVVTVFMDKVKRDRKYLAQLARFVRGKTVYLTIDLDALDPSIMPSVGTPEPDGLSWTQLLDVIRVVRREAESIPVVDVVELSPISGIRAPDFLAAKLVHLTIAQALMRGNGSVRCPQKGID